jgi:hypothetical protein
MESKTQAQAQQNEELWWSLLTGENSKLRRERRFFGLFPTPDTQNARCKMCLTHSLFREGRMLYELIPTMPEFDVEDLLAERSIIAWRCLT